MDKYIHITDPDFQKPGSLPRSWTDPETGLTTLGITPATALEHGFLLCTFVNENYDGTIQTRSAEPVIVKDATDATCTYTLTDKPLVDVQDWKKNQVKAIARSKIMAITVNEDKQRNLIARSAELLEKKVDGTIVQAETDEMTANKTIWDQVKAIRAASDQIEAEIDGLEDEEISDLENNVSVKNHDINTNPLWP